MKKQAQYSLFLYIIISLISSLFLSCQKQTQDAKEELINKIDTLLTDENINYLINTQDFMEYFILMKKQNAMYVDSLANPSEFERASSRKTMLLRFGVLCSDIAYARIIGKKTQLPEYDKLFQKYVNDLNISSFFRLEYESYFKAILNQEISDSLFVELVKKFRDDRKQIIDKAKMIDLDFLVYYTLGAALEQSYLTVKSILADNSNKYLAEINKHNKLCDKTNTFSSWKFIKITNEFVTDNPHFIEFKNEINKSKSIYNIFLDRIENGKDFTLQDIQDLDKLIVLYRNEILN